MSLKSRRSRVEERYLGQARDRDPDFPYTVTREAFDSRIKNTYVVVQSMAEDDDQVATLSETQAHAERNEADEWLLALPLQEWYDVYFAQLLKFPHRIEFDLNEFGLGCYEGTVLSLPHIVYAPV